MNHFPAYTIRALQAPGCLVCSQSWMCPDTSPPSPLASAMLTTYASGCPMHVAPKWPTSLHMCCTNKVTQIEIDDGSTVARCTRVGCETVWVRMFFTIILAHPSSNGQCSSTGHAKAWVPMSCQTGYAAPMMDTAVVNTQEDKV